MVTSLASWAISHRGKLSLISTFVRACGRAAFFFFFFPPAFIPLANTPGRLVVNANEIAISVGR